MDTDGLMATGESALRKVARSPADQGEVFIQSGWGRSYTLEGGIIKYGSFGGEYGMAIRVVRDGRLGFGYCTRERDLGRTIRAALSLSRIAPPTGFAFAGPGKVRRTSKTFDRSILSLEDSDGLAMIQGMLEGAREVSGDLSFPGGGVGFGADAFAVLNTEGVSVSDSGTFISAGISTILGKEGTPDVSTGGYDVSGRTATLDTGAIGEKAGRLAVDSRGAKPLGHPGTMDVVFTPDAFAELVEHLIAPAFYGDRVVRGESHLTGKLGKKVAHEKLRIVDDGLLPDGANTAGVDDEGYPSGRTTLMSRGIVRRFLNDAASAGESGMKPTGSGIRMDNWGSDRSFKVTPRTGARNLVLSWEDRRSLDELIGEVRNGVYVHELLGSHTANRISGDFSIGSPLLFRIRKGEVREPLQSVMLAGNMFSALEEMGGMADDHRNVGGTLGPVAVRTPSVRLRGVNVTG